MSASTSVGRDFLDAIFTLEELLDLDADELAQLEEIAGDTALVAAFWRRRRRLRCPGERKA